MARRKKAGELRDTEVECGYCDAIIPEDALRCPKCGKLFSAAKKIMAFAIVVIVVIASISFLAIDHFRGPQEGFVPGPDPDGPENGDGETPPANNGRAIVIELHEADTPNTVDNFKKYVQDGFYDGLIFHRVIPGFMIQGGGFYPDMTEKPTTYPPIPLEISPNLRHVDGAVAMARTTDPNSATSQFYICDGPQSFLDDEYAVFGQVISGMDVVREITMVETADVVPGHDDVPIHDVTIVSARLGTDGRTVTLIVDF